MSGTDLSDALADMWRSVLLFVPTALAFLAILIIGYLLARLVRAVVQRALNRVGFDRAVERSGFGRALRGGRLEPSELCAKIAFYAVVLFAVQLAFGLWGPNAVSDLLTLVISWLPRAFVAIVIIVVAAAIAGAVRDLIDAALGALPYGRLLARTASVFILGLGLIAALEQVGIATAVTGPVLIAVLATVAGVIIVGVGGGLIRPMQQRWEGWLERAGTESQVIREHARTYAETRAAEAAAEEARIAAEAEAARAAEEARKAQEARLAEEARIAAETAAREKAETVAREKAEAAAREKAEAAAREDVAEAARKADAARKKAEAEAREKAARAAREAQAAREARERAAALTSEAESDQTQVITVQMPPADDDPDRTHIVPGFGRPELDDDRPTFVPGFDRDERDDRNRGNHDRGNQDLGNQDDRTEALPTQAISTQASPTQAPPAGPHRRTGETAGASAGDDEPTDPQR